MKLPLKQWCHQWGRVNPITGQIHTVTTKKKLKSDALVRAGEIKNELLNGEYKPVSKVTWDELIDLYDEKVLKSKARTTAKKFYVVMANMKELKAAPDRVCKATTALVTDYASKMREAKMSECSIKSYLGCLRALLRWAHRRKMLNEVPHFDMPTRTDQASRRAITTEEFERIMEAVPLCTDTHVDQWRFFLRGLWWGGLRISESCKLSWDDPTTLCVELGKRRPLLSIPPRGQKKPQMHAAADGSRTV